MTQLDLLGNPIGAGGSHQVCRMQSKLAAAVERLAGGSSNAGKQHTRAGDDELLGMCDCCMLCVLIVRARMLHAVCAYCKGQDAACCVCSL